MTADGAGGDRAAHAWGSTIAKRLGSLSVLSPEELRLIASLRSTAFEADVVIDPRSLELNQGWIIRSGWCGRLSIGAGDDRPITTVLLPGDSFGIGAAPWAGDRLPVRTLTSCVLLDATAIREVIRLRSPAYSRLAEACGRAGWLEQICTLNHITRLSGLAGYARVAHFITEVLVRLGQVGLAPNNAFDVPISQQAVADILGLSGIHMNRIARKLKQDGLIDTTRGVIKVIEKDRLAAIANFNIASLENTHQTRLG